ncbi:biotin-dependent carboxyltransferase family protein [Amycolatopsis sp. H20-H5]|uniref:5-oxoprolinase subunit C family protein n=1 Tax=Amycolatopsis sp. H20-H5 TaxID=3046309 RepID=UPI002DBB2C05|nr:biotin-dependent carboxyltransferase family protein [Amycolatopsis sp. H20-H5]MEC3977019.1 biotin-dependent carboxyltransferase family protein [Amycolatopsis sp. H20-H5]
MRALEVVATGPLALVQDLGRPGHAHLGVPPSGALDTGSLRLANRLTGNPESAAGIESVLGGLVLRARSSCTVAVTGPVVRVRVDGRDRGSHVAIHLGEGQTLTIGTPGEGLRCYLAVSGGLAAEPELGSRSADVLSGIGPPPLRAGDVLPLGTPGGVPAGADVVVPFPTGETLTLPVTLGPRAEWIADVERGLAEWWTVTAESNRVGLRLDGPVLRRAAAYADDELPSEGLVTGAIQVPPSGLPVVFLADHPTTGGYPVAAVVRAVSLGALGQARPGTLVRFQPSR